LSLTYGIHILSLRPNDEQQQIWRTFEQVLTKHKQANIKFEHVEGWFGIGLPIFTMFLFWIDSANFLPLDKNTRAMLQRYDVLENMPTAYAAYKELLAGEANTALFRDVAWVATSNNRYKKLSPLRQGAIRDFLKGNVPVDAKGGFSIIALMPGEECAPKLLKTLLAGELYSLHQAYKIEGEIVKYTPALDCNLYNQSDIDVSIHAIVGKNGTGKSTLTELLFVAINNIAYKFIHHSGTKSKKNAEWEANRVDSPPEYKDVEGLHLTIFVKNSHLYRLELKGSRINIYRYIEIDDEFREAKRIEHTKFDIRTLFYSIVVNYSQHGLNCLHMGDWVQALFETRDGYQTPILIEPTRTNGNIEVNSQERLVQQRLLASLLQPIDSESNTRQLTEYCQAKKLKLRCDKLHFDKAIELGNTGKRFIFERYRLFGVILLEQFCRIWGVKDIANIEIDFNQCRSISNIAQLYILRKLDYIAVHYTRYNMFFDKKINRLNVEQTSEYFDKLLNDRSHITHALRQTVNFLKSSYPPLHSIEYETDIIIEIASYSDYITEQISDDRDSTIVEFVPPPFLKVDILLDQDIEFQTLSSGEKQRIYSIHSILGHLYNLNAVASPLIQYPYINIVLDEIELYFHPELQRRFITELLRALGQLDAENIRAINILFITHSPFILSDIPVTNILLLDKKANEPLAKSTTLKKPVKTFGANIHELLITDFFMDGSIGQFAQDQIGEGYIEGILNNHLDDICTKLETKYDETNAVRIDELKRELKELGVNSLD
jgi:predicted ATPase